MPDFAGAFAGIQSEHDSELISRFEFWPYLETYAIDAQKNYWQNFKATGLDRRQLFRWQFSISAGAAHEGYSVQRCPRFGKV